MGMSANILLRNTYEFVVAKYIEVRRWVRGSYVNSETRVPDVVPRA